MSFFTSTTRDSNTAIEVQKYLKYFGLENFDLNSNWRDQFIKIINTPNMVPIINFNNNLYEYIYINKENECLTKKFIKKKHIYSSSYNNIIKCEDVLTSQDVVIRISQEDNNKEDLYMSFLDNLKNIVLYIYSKCYMETKIMPEIFAFGFNYKNNTFCLIMEHINYQFKDFINLHFTINISKINHMICNIFKLLECLNYHGLKFRHGDLKFNNILVEPTGEPLLIDFGLSSFILPNSSVIFNPVKIDSNVIIDYHYKYPELDTFISDKLNMTHDIILLIMSCYYIIAITTEKELQMLMNTNLTDVKCIVDGRELYKYMRSFFKISTKKEYIDKIYQYKLYFDSYSNIDIFRDIRNGFIDSKTMIIFDYSDIVKYIS